MRFLLTIINSKWVYLLSIIIGFAQAFAFGFSFDSKFIRLPIFLSFFSLLIFLWVVVRLVPKRAALFSYIFALSYFGLGLNWIYISMARFGGASVTFSIIANLAVVAYLSLYWMLSGYLISKLGKTTNQKLLISAPIIVLFEWIRSIFLVGFPWLSIGYAWVDAPLSIFSSIGGVFGVSLIIVLLVATVLLDINKKIKISIFLLISIIGISPRFFNISNKDKPIKVALVQGNIPVITKYNPDIMNKNIIRYLSMTRDILKDNSDIDVIVWPESAIPYFYDKSLDFLSYIKKIQHKYSFLLISGIPRRVNNENKMFFNSIVLQNPNVEKNQFYDKYHLLPFGEYIPFRWFLRFFKNFVEIPMSDFSPGGMIQPNFNVGTTTLSPSICFEIVFGNEIRKNALDSSILLNVSNDAWFGKSKAQSQHLNIARMRAIENQKPLVRATNDGLTVIVNKYGKVIKDIKPFEIGYLIAKVTPNKVKTIYARFGDLPLIIFIIIFLSSIFSFRLKVFLFPRKRFYRKL